MSEFCPVCGGAVDEAGTFSVPVDGGTVKFCGLDCLHVFQLYPEVYLGLEEPSTVLIEDTSAT